MNNLLEKKLLELESAEQFECWYLVKHSTNFAHLCYLVSFLKDYVEHPGVSINLENHINIKANEINNRLHLGLSNNYRALRVAAFFGLIKMTSSKYDECIFTETYNEIISRCGGAFEKTELYQDIITRQIEKMYIASSIDEGKNNVRKNYSIYPIMFLYKVILELGKVTGDYSISMVEYRYLVATTKKYEDYLETMLYIKLLRDEENDTYRDSTVINAFKKLRDKFDNRMNKAIELLEGISCLNDRITIKQEYIESISRKVYLFESKNNIMEDNAYINFLCSSKSLFDEERNGDSFDLEILTPEWFRNKAIEFEKIDEEAKDLYLKFKTKFGISALKLLSGEDLLKALFLGGSTDNLCHELEYVTRNRELFGSVKGGNAFKYPLFFDKDTLTWMSGTRQNPVDLSLDDAIILGTKVRDQLVSAVELIEKSLPLDTIEDYLALYTNLYALMPELVDSLWVTKYLHMIFPDVIPTFYNKEWQIKVIEVLNLRNTDSTYGKLGSINSFVKLCEISNVVFAQIFYKYCQNVEKNVVDDTDSEVVEEVIERLVGGQNIILYGVPGAGKSFTLEKDYVDDNTIMERVVFHPDYTYSDFVGQILPQSHDGDVSYNFIPGPFAKIVREAYLNPTKKYILAIEEINRGNAPAIFGDIFQLLDRKPNGSSRYTIMNADIAKVVFGDANKSIYIPSNLSLICTMNTSDQNVFTLDTAFQRRWNMRLIENVFKKNTEEERLFAEHCILDTKVTWEHFCETINAQILEKNQNMTSSEDKRLGTHFVLIDDLEYDETELSDTATPQAKHQAELRNRRFPEKVIKYLWDDAFKFYRDEIFNPNYNSLEKIISVFVTEKGNDRFKIFKDNIKAAIESGSKTN